MFKITMARQIWITYPRFLTKFIESSEIEDNVKRVIERLLDFGRKTIFYAEEFYIPWGERK